MSSESASTAAAAEYLKGAISQRERHSFGAWMRGVITMMVKMLLLPLLSLLMLLPGKMMTTS